MSGDHRNHRQVAFQPLRARLHSDALEMEGFMMSDRSFLQVALSLALGAVGLSLSLAVAVLNG